MGREDGVSSANAPFRLGCVEIESLALQWLRCTRPDWWGYPVAVLSSPGGAGRVVEACERARAHGVRRGMRYGEALAFEPRLRAQHVGPEVIERLRREVAKVLLGCAPRVLSVSRRAPFRGFDGVFWLECEGLVGPDRLWPEPAAWGRALRERVATLGFTARVAVGGTQLGTLARLRSTSAAVSVIDGGERAERCSIDRLSLEQLGISRRLRRRLERLGWSTLGALRAVEAPELERRFGPQAGALGSLVATMRFGDLERWRQRAALQDRRGFEPAVTEIGALVAAIERRLQRLLGERSTRAIAAVHCRLGLESGRVHEQRLELLEPCADPAWVAQLLRLRFEGELQRGRGDGVQRLELRLQAAAPRARRRALLVCDGGRGDEASILVGRALSRVRARFGEEAVWRVAVRDAYLPEAQHGWQRWRGRAGGRRAGGGGGGERRKEQNGGREDRGEVATAPSWVRVRRLLDRPRMLGGVGRGARGQERLAREEAVAIGPWRISGGWWGGAREQAREYAVRLRNGRWRWEYERPEEGTRWLQGWLD